MISESYKSKSITTESLSKSLKSGSGSDKSDSMSDNEELKDSYEEESEEEEPSYGSASGSSWNVNKAKPLDDSIVAKT